MKKLLVVIFISFTSVAIYAQGITPEDNSKMQIGVSVGPSYTHVTSPPSKQSDFFFRRTSYSAAVHFQYKFNSIYALRTELFYGRKRAYLEGLSNSIYFLDQYKISLPVFFRLYMQRFFVETGIYLGCGFGEGYRSIYYSSDKKELIKKSYSYSKNDNDLFALGWCLGAGLDVINREKFSLSILIRNDLELTTEWPINDTRFNTVNFLVGANYKF